MDDEPKDKNDPFGLKRLEEPGFESQERKKLIPVDQVSDEGVPSPEVQKAFEDFFIGKENSFQPESRRELKFDTEKLLLVTRTKNGEVNREYYKPVEGIPVTLIARAYFSQSGRGYEANGLDWFSEDRREHLMVSFWNAGEKNTPQMIVNLRFQGRELGLAYSEETGGLEFLAHHPRETSGFNLISAKQVKDLKRDKVISKQTNDYGGVVQISYQATYVEDVDLIKIKKQENGEVKDEVEIPATLDITEIKEKLFPKTYFSDPYETDPGEDTSWKRPDLLEILKIKWERH